MTTLSFRASITHMDPRAKPLPGPWREPVGAWTQHLNASDLTPASIGTRRAHVCQLARAVPTGPDAITPDHLTAWLARDLATETRRSIRTSLKTFFAWQSHRTGRPDPAADLPRIRPAQPQPRPAPPDALSEALDRADARTALILRLAAHAGLRRGEIAQVHSRDLSRSPYGWDLLVHGKGRRERTVPLSDVLAAEVRSACMAGGGWALPSSSGGHLSAPYVGKLASRALPEEWTLHTLRHRYATAAYAGSRDTLAVQQLLGHASPATTQQYVQLPDDARRAAAQWAA